jgi:hypothetical protein
MTSLMRRGLAVAGVGLALSGILMLGRDDPPDATVSRRPVRGAAARASAANTPGVVDLRLHRLRISPSASENIERNLFRFQSRPLSAPPASPDPPQERPVPSVAIVDSPPMLPPIPLHYIGLLEAPAQAGRVAVLSDGRGNIFYGREGDTIEGRYLMLRVGPISADLSYLDGRGRQTIRLSGQ